MRIAENTPSCLKLRDRTFWISVLGLFPAAIFLACHAFDRDASVLLIPAALFTLVCGFLALRATDVTFDKIERACSIRRSDVLRVSRRRLAFDDIINIEVEISPQSDSEDTCCRLSLLTTSGVVPLTACYKSPGLERYNKMRDRCLRCCSRMLISLPRPIRFARW